MWNAIKTITKTRDPVAIVLSISRCDNDSCSECKFYYSFSKNKCALDVSSCSILPMIEDDGYHGLALVALVGSVVCQISKQKPNRPKLIPYQKYYILYYIVLYYVYIMWYYIIYIFTYIYIYYYYNNILNIEYLIS